jgi:acyl-CoA thioesterase FadM
MGAGLSQGEELARLPIVRPRDSQVICRAATLWVLVDLATRRPSRIDREMIERFNPLKPPVVPMMKDS